MNRNNQFLGLVLVALGLFLLLLKSGLVHFTILSLWPLFLLIPGLAFHFFFFKTKNPGLLVPGAILTVYGILFLLTETFGYDLLTTFWPVFILGPGIGLLEMYLLGGRESGVLVASLIIITIGSIFLFFNLLTSNFTYVLGILLILSGVFLLFRNREKKEANF